MVVADLGGLDMPALRRAARAMAAGFNPVVEAARQVPVCVLASALGLDGPAVVDAVAAVGPAYFGHSPMATHPILDAAIAGADAAVARLVAELRPGDPEMLAARIGLLVQAYDATAGLITNTLAATRKLRSSTATRWPVEVLLAETLRYDPPVRVTRRLATAALRVGGVEIATGVVYFSILQRRTAIRRHSTSRIASTPAASNPAASNPAAAIPASSIPASSIPASSIPASSIPASSALGTSPSADRRGYARDATMRGRSRRAWWKGCGRGERRR